MSRRVVRPSVGRRSVLVAALLVITSPAVSLAQIQTPPASSRATRAPMRETRWEIAAFGGVAIPALPEQGLYLLPDRNPLFPTVNGRFSRLVPSWFFGDGAALFAASATTGTTGDYILPLDDVVAGPSGSPHKSWSVGARVTRALNPRVSIEGTFEYSRGQLRLRESAVAGIEATRASFVTAWNILFAADPATFQNPTVTAVSTFDRGATRQIVANGAIVFNILTRRRNTPYTSVAVGVLSNGGRAPSFTLVGHYTTLLNGTAPIDETDSMTLRYAIDRTLVAVTVGLGLKHMVTERWGLRVEMREQLCSNPITNLVSASPQRVLTSNVSQQGAAATPRASSVQLANMLSSGTQSSLAGSLSGFKLFTGTGMESRLTFTGGIFWRF